MDARRPGGTGPRLPKHATRRGGGKSPLLRPSDRIESWFSRACLFLLLMCVPALAAAAGWTVYGSQSRAAREQAAERHQVDAQVVAESAPGGERGSGRAHEVVVRWTERDGTVRTAAARESGRTPPGSQVRLWVDRDGEVTQAPLPAEEAVVAAGFVVVVTAGAGALLLHWAREGARLALDRRRYAQWEAEWAVAEPRWTGRRPS